MSGTGRRGGRRMARRLGIVFVAAMCAFTTFGFTASAAPAQHARASIGYLALGDSVVFGYRPSEVTPPTDYFNAKNFVGYPEYLGQLPGVREANASCPGETTDSFMDVHAQSNGCENSVGSPVGYRTLFPLHVTYFGSQLDYAVHYLRTHPNVQVVSIGIGANDFFLCQKLNSDNCTGSDFADTLQHISANLTKIYTALRERAHFKGTLVQVSYYSFNYSDPTDVAVSTALNNALAGPTKQFGGIIADGFGAFQAASASANGDTCKAGLRIPLPSGDCDVHPSARGQQLLAEAVARAVLGNRGAD